MNLKVSLEPVPGDFRLLHTEAASTRVEATMGVIREIMSLGMGTEFGSLGDCLVEAFDLVETQPGAGVGLRLESERVFAVKLTQHFEGGHLAEGVEVPEGGFSVEFWVPKL